MRGREFRARDKKVNKLGRDGLVEQNKTTGEERRVSQRTADISFGPERAPTQQLGRQTAQRSQQKRHQVYQQITRGNVTPPVQADSGTRPDNNMDFYAQPETLDVNGQTETVTQDIIIPDAPVIRNTRDMPVSEPPPTGRRRKRRKNKFKNKSKGRPANSAEDNPSNSSRDVPTDSPRTAPADDFRTDRPQNAPADNFQDAPADTSKSVPAGNIQDTPADSPKDTPAENFWDIPNDRPRHIPVESAGTVPEQPSYTASPKRWQEAHSGKFEVSRQGPLHFEEDAAPVRDVKSKVKAPGKRQKRPPISAVTETAAVVENTPIAETPRPAEPVVTPTMPVTAETPVEAPRQDNPLLDAVPDIGQRKEGLPLEEIRAEDTDHLPDAKPPPQAGRLHFEDTPAPAGGSSAPENEPLRASTPSEPPTSTPAPKQRYRLKEHDSHLRFEHPSRLKKTEPVQQSKRAKQQKLYQQPHFQKQKARQTEQNQQQAQAAQQAQTLPQEQYAQQEQFPPQEQLLQHEQHSQREQLLQHEQRLQQEQLLQQESTQPRGQLLQQEQRPQREQPPRQEQFSQQAQPLQQEQSPQPEQPPQQEPPPQRESSLEHRQTPSREQTPQQGQQPQPEQSQEHPPQQRLHFEDENKAASGTKNPPKSDAPAKRQQRQYQQAERRVEQASRKLERAQSQIPTKRRARLEAQYDSETGKVRHRLQFEKEQIPENAPPSLPNRAVGAVTHTVGSTVAMKAHQKMREVERENVAVEASHKGEFTAEQGVGRFLRWNKKRLHSKPYRAVRQAEQRLITQQTRLAWQTALRDNPELRRKNVLSKWYQKQRIKRKYAQAAREAKEAARQTQNVLSRTEKVARAVAQFAANHKAALALVALLVFIVLLFSAGTSSCGAMLTSIQSGYLSATYMANEDDICNADLRYTELEMELQLDIDNTKTNYPGYDAYTFNIGEISHDPFELMAYLSTVYNAFSYEDIRTEIEALFNRQYTLTRTPTTETRYNDDGTSYTCSVLKTTLTVRPLSDVIAESLDSEQTDRYNVYMQTLGNRQAFGNPFSFAWLGNVSSTYGWRIHPISKTKNLHRGVDIAVAQGTEIHAVQDGTVVSAGDAGAYGLCVVIQDDKGYQSRYAHCSSLSVSAGQEVKRGDVIAAVGSTGNSTGPHLHLEVKVNGEYLNPIFFVETGGVGAAPGTPGGPEIPSYPGEPVTDATYAAMLAEAQKYLGYPYVWGGDSPSTSFDCSGFVSWVLNHSGWNIGRRGAQGLYNICTPVSAAEAKPGDLIFFTKTYSAPNPVSHVGIYVGNSQMIHCGDPISYENIDSKYWRQHFYSYGRLS